MLINKQYELFLNFMNTIGMHIGNHFLENAFHVMCGIPQLTVTHHQNKKSSNISLRKGQSRDVELTLYRHTIFFPYPYCYLFTTHQPPITRKHF